MALEWHIFLVLRAICEEFLLAQWYRTHIMSLRVEMDWRKSMLCINISGWSFLIPFTGNAPGSCWEGWIWKELSACSYHWRTH